MSDYIKREAVYNAIHGLYSKCPNSFAPGIAAAVAELARVPADDVVQVVRCADCAYYEEEDEDDYLLFGLCSNFDVGMPEDGFCSDGVKRIR